MRRDSHDSRKTVSENVRCCQLAAVRYATLELLISCRRVWPTGIEPHLRLEMVREYPCRWYYKEQSLVLADSCRRRCLEQSYGSDAVTTQAAKRGAARTSSRLYCGVRRDATQGFPNPEVRSIASWLTPRAGRLVL